MKTKFLTLSFWNNLLQSFSDVIFPEFCISCKEEFPVQDSCFCISCLSDLPFTDYHLNRDNTLEKLFWGRTEIEKAASLFFFQKGEIVQDMIHDLKYNSKAYIGLALGKYFGKMLIGSEFIKDIDLIIPVPIHRSKKRKRGYNQCSLIAEGFHKETGIPVNESILLKKKNTRSQTEKTREERLNSLKSSFEIRNLEELKGKHILLIDDILTTGATIETAAEQLLVHNAKISLAVMAIGKY